MNPLLVEGRIKNKKKVEAYIHAVAKELGIHRLYSKILHVRFSTKLAGEAQGYCWGDKKTHAEIDIARTSCGEPMSMESMMQTLAHEMVHVKQWAKGEMQELVRQSKTRFNGTLFGETEYWDRPWEIEAHGRERGLFIRWFEQSQWKKCKWANY